MFGIGAKKEIHEYSLGKQGHKVSREKQNKIRIIWPSREYIFGKLSPTQINAPEQL